MRHPPDAVEVGGEHGAPILFADVQRPLVVADTGIVEHHIDAAECGLRGIQCGLDACAVCDVEHDRQGLAAIATDFLGQLGQALDTASRQHHAATGPCGGHGQVCADATGCARYQDGLVFQGKQVHVIHGSPRHPAVTTGLPVKIGLRGSEPVVLHVEAQAVAGHQQACLAFQRCQFPIHVVARRMQFALIERRLTAVGAVRQGPAGEQGLA
ncbi:hypothetical protein D3C80_1209210 [compost metagenome]